MVLLEDTMNRRIQGSRFLTRHRPNFTVQWSSRNDKITWRRPLILVDAVRTLQSANRLNAACADTAHRSVACRFENDTVVDCKEGK